MGKQKYNVQKPILISSKIVLRKRDTVGTFLCFSLQNNVK